MLHLFVCALYSFFVHQTIGLIWKSHYREGEKGLLNNQSTVEPRHSYTIRSRSLFELRVLRMAN